MCRISAWTRAYLGTAISGTHVAIAAESDFRPHVGLGQIAAGLEMHGLPLLDTAPEDSVERHDLVLQCSDAAVGVGEHLFGSSLTTDGAVLSNEPDTDAGYGPGIITVLGRDEGVQDVESCRISSRGASLPSMTALGARLIRTTGAVAGTVRRLAKLVSLATATALASSAPARLSELTSTMQSTMGSPSHVAVVLP